MAGEPAKLTLSYSADALRTLDEIWDWNAAQYGPDHATAYVAFLRREIDKVAENVLIGTALEPRPRLRYIVIKRRRHGHGHVAVYSHDDTSVIVLQIYHTAQDWRERD